MGKKILSAVLCAALLVSVAPTAVLSVSAEETADYGLAKKADDGVILHAFNWSYNTIKENLPEIAEAGYTSIQTSPVQAPKDYGNFEDTNGQWWKLYQPLGFSIAEKDSWLGTKAELTDLCAEAEKYGIKIICDIVSNHLALGSTKNTFAADVELYEPELYGDETKYIHQLNKGVNDSSVKLITQGTLDGLPDLNTSEELVQKRVISLLEECIDCGVDGFRFDAAKHIETPDDGDECASNFWPNVIETSTKYAESKGVELYCYGEILNTPGAGRDITSYTKYLDITDNKAGDATLAYVVGKNPENVVKAQGYSYKNDSPSNYVLWAESHDTYMGESGSAGISNTKNVSNEDIAKAWAIVASRSESTPLYLARPNIIMGKEGDTAWKSNVVSEVNKFHNKYIGVSDEVYNDGNVIAVQRGDNGIVLVNLDDNSDISVSTKSMKDGTYTDAVSGNSFTVKNGTISGKLGASGIAVVYEGAETTPRAAFSVADKTSFKKDTLKVTLSLENAESGTYSINGAAAVEFKDSTTITIGEGVSVGSEITVKVTATDGKKTTESTQTYYKEEGTNTGVFVYFDNTPFNWENVNVYAYYDDIVDGEKVTLATNGSWPGVPMEIDDETGYYYYEVPADLPVGKACVIFNNGESQSPDLRITSDSMIFKDRAFRDYNPNGTTLVYGDVDGDGEISVADSLSILRCSVDLETLSDAQREQADIDKDGDISSGDALYVLRYSVDIRDGNIIGQEFLYTGAVDSDDKKDDGKSKSTFYIIDKAGWLFSDGCKLWVVNNDTKEELETTKESPFDDNSKYAYVELPEDWKSISVYRTKFSDSDTSSAYNSWNCGEIKEGSNGVNIGTKLKFVTFDPNE